MQDVNNDMDNLFCKAAEQYPLKTDGADWSKVLVSLQEASAPVAEEKKKKKRRFLWLFLLLPLGLLWAVYYQGNRQPGQKAIVEDEEVKYGDNDVKKDEANINKNNSSEKVNDIASGLSSVEMKADKKSAAVSKDKTVALSDLKVRLHQKSDVDNLLIHPAFRKNKEDFGYRQTLSDNKISLPDNRIGNGVITAKNNFPDAQPEVLSNRIDVNKKDNINQKADEIIQTKNDSVAIANTRADSTSNNNNSRANNSKPVKIKPHVQTGFYAGLLASFDLSTIKLQRINKTGYGLQMLLGYQFSDRLSIESGLGGTVKKYYSKGKYFDKKKTGIPDIVNIYYTNGYCRMFEVPVNVKYNFISTKKSNLFVTAGSSSYFMKKENYSYRGDYRGRVYDTVRYYNNSGANWFSLANAGIGYETKLGRHSSLRIESYIKVPLHGIGIANLPIASMGISAGFTRKF